MSMKFGKVSKTKDLNEYDDVRIVGKTFPTMKPLEKEKPEGRKEADAGSR